MAGFDFSVPRHATGEQLQRGLLRWIQRAAKDLGLEFRYRTEGEQLWAEVHGPLPIMHVLRAYLGQDLGTYAAAASAPRTRQQRFRIASQLLEEFDEGLDGLTDLVHSASADLGGTPNSIVFDYGDKSHLAHQLRSLTTTLILDIQGRISQRSTVEEVHTVLEQLMRDALGGEARGRSFAEMVDAVEAQGIITADQATDIKELKDFRRDSKHRGQGFDESEADRLVGVSVASIHRLLARIAGPVSRLRT